MEQLKRELKYVTKWWNTLGVVPLYGYMCPSSGGFIPENRKWMTIPKNQVFDLKITADADAVARARNLVEDRKHSLEKAKELLRKLESSST